MDHSNTSKQNFLHYVTSRIRTQIRTKALTEMRTHQANIDRSQTILEPILAHHDKHSATTVLDAINDQNLSQQSAVQYLTDNLEMTLKFIGPVWGLIDLRDQITLVGLLVKHQPQRAEQIFQLTFEHLQTNCELWRNPQSFWTVLSCYVRNRGLTWFPWKYVRAISQRVARLNPELNKRPSKYRLHFILSSLQYQSYEMHNLAELLDGDMIAALTDTLLSPQCRRQIWERCLQVMVQLLWHDKRWTNSMTEAIRKVETILETMQGYIVELSFKWLTNMILRDALPQIQAVRTSHICNHSELCQTPCQSTNEVQASSLSMYLYSIMQQEGFPYILLSVETITFSLHSQLEIGPHSLSISVLHEKWRLSIRCYEILIEGGLISEKPDEFELDLNQSASAKDIQNNLLLFMSKLINQYGDMLKVSFNQMALLQWTHVGELLRSRKGINGQFDN